MALPQFVSFCEGLAARGFTVQRAEYWNDVFGSWTIEFSSPNVVQHRLSWDGRDRWLYLERERPENERKPAISSEQLRKMSYEDGVSALHSRQEDAWQDKWIGRDEADQSLDRALEELGRS